MTRETFSKLKLSLVFFIAGFLLVIRLDYILAILALVFAEEIIGGLVWFASIAVEVETEEITETVTGKPGRVLVRAEDVDTPEKIAALKIGIIDGKYTTIELD